MLTTSVKLQKVLLQCWAYKIRRLIITCAAAGNQAANDILTLLVELKKHPDPLTEEIFLYQIYEFQKAIEQ